MGKPSNINIGDMDLGSLFVSAESGLVGKVVIYNGKKSLRVFTNKGDIEYLTIEDNKVEFGYVIEKELDIAEMTFGEMVSEVRRSSRNRGIHTDNIDVRWSYLKSEFKELEAEVLKFSEEGNDLEELKTKAGMEMYDIFWNMVELSDILGINLPITFHNKMNIIKYRDFDEE